VNILDTVSILGGYDQIIIDWALGDDRVFSGNIAPLLQTGDTVTDCYFTLKASPPLPDAQSIIQKHITTTASQAGQITGGTNILVNVFSADYEGLVFVGPVYYWDFRVITVLGHTYTVATGQVSYRTNVTQTNIAGTPGPLPMGPNNGQPRFRGFCGKNPMFISSIAGTFVKGDYFRNGDPQSGEPSGWVCTIGGALPGGATFRTDGIVGNSP